MPRVEGRSLRLTAERRSMNFSKFLLVYMCKSPVILISSVGEETKHYSRVLKSARKPGIRSILTNFTKKRQPSVNRDYRVESCIKPIKLLILFCISSPVSSNAAFLYIIWLLFLLLIRLLPLSFFLCFSYPIVSSSLAAASIVLRRH